MNMLKNCTYYFFILVCTLTSYTLSAQSNEPCLSLSLNEVTAEAGDVVCIDLTTTGFTNVLGLQWSITYDPTLLEFAEVKNFGLPQLDANSFGVLAIGANNAITTAWSSATAQRVDLPDDARIVSLCFEALVTSGKAVVEIFNTPTLIEIVDGNLDLFSVSGIAGGVRFGDTPAASLTIEDVCVLPPTCSGSGQALVDVTISGGEAPFTYLWTGPSGFVTEVPDFEAMETGFYSLEVTDANGQVAKGMVQVEQTTRVSIANATITAHMYNNQKEGKPVHEWIKAREDNVLNLNVNISKLDKFMTTEVFVVKENDLVELVAKIMEWKNIHHIPVVNDLNKVTGIITNTNLKDILGKDQKLIVAKDIMIKEIITVDSETSIDKANTIMLENKIGCLPIIEMGELVGILTKNDLNKLLDL